MTTLKSHVDSRTLNALNKNVGKNLSFYYLVKDNLCSIDDECLEDISQLDHLKVMGEMYVPFIDYNFSLVYVINHDTGKIIYKNLYPMDHKIDTLYKKIKAILACFGREEAEKYLNLVKEQEEYYANIKSKDDDWFLKYKNMLLKESCKLINPKLVKNWKTMIDANIKDAYKLRGLEVSIIIMKELTCGANFDEVYNAICGMHLPRDLVEFSFSLIFGFYNNRSLYFGFSAYWGSKHVSKEDKNASKKLLKK